MAYFLANATNAFPAHDRCDFDSYEKECNEVTKMLTRLELGDSGESLDKGLRGFEGHGAICRLFLREAYRDPSVEMLFNRNKQ